MHVLSEGMALRFATRLHALTNKSVCAQEPLNGPFLNLLFSSVVEREKGPSGHSGKRPIKGGQQLIKQGKQLMIENFVKGRFWRMCPCSAFLYGRFVFCALVPVFGAVVPFLYPRSGSWGSAPTTTLLETTIPRTPDIKVNGLFSDTPAMVENGPSKRSMMRLWPTRQCWLLPSTGQDKFKGLQCGPLQRTRGVYTIGVENLTYLK